MNDQTKTIVNWLDSGSLNIFGLPFAGKDTQANVLAELFDGVVISGGDILRHSKKNEKVQKLMAAGDIIPSDLFEEIVVPYLSNPEYVGKPLILSEVGRMEGEQQVIARAANSSGHPLKAMILLKLSDDDVFNRFEASQQQHDRGERADDKREVLQTRLDKYHEKVTPVIEWYSELDLLIEVDGSKTRQQVTEEILIKLAQRALSS